MCVKRSGIRILRLLGVLAELPLEKPDKERYWQWLKKLRGEDEDKFFIDHLTRHLDVLDGKANAVILFTSILAAVYLGMFGDVEKARGQMAPCTGSALRWTFLSGGALSLVGVMLLLCVEKIHWPDPETANYSDYLLDLRNRRTIYYRAAWLLTVVSVIILAACVAFTYVVEFLKA
jgi:hypothetical protein